MKIIEITETKMTDLYEYAEKMLKYGGKMMSCLEDMKEGKSIGHRGYGNRYDMGERDGYGERDWEDDDDDGGYGNRMGERRGVRGTGRYSRYR